MVLLPQQPQGRPVPRAVGVPAQRAQLVAVQQHEAEARRRAEVVRLAVPGRRGGRAGGGRRAAAEAALRQAGPAEVVQLVVAPGVVHRHPQPSQRRQHPPQRRLRLGRAAPRVDAVDAVAQLQHEGGRRSLGGPGLHGGPQQAEAVPVVPPPAAPEIVAVLRVRVLDVRDNPEREARGGLHGGRCPVPEGAGGGEGRGGAEERAGGGMAALRGWRCWRLWRPWSLPPGATVAFPSRAQPLQGWAAALLLPHGAVPTPSCRYASRLPPGSGPRAASQRTVSGRGAARRDGTGRDGGVPRSLRPRSPRPGAGTPPSAVCGQRPAPDRALPRQPVSWRALGAALILCGGLLLAMKRVKKAKEDSECSRSPAAVAGGGGGIAAPFSKLLLLCLPLYVLTCAVAVAADAF